jgi:hypothetical protein
MSPEKLQWLCMGMIVFPRVKQCYVHHNVPGMHPEEMVSARHAYYTNPLSRSNTPSDA